MNRFENPQNPKEAIRAIRFIHFALCMGAFLFAMVTLFLHDFVPGPFFDRGYSGEDDIYWPWFLIACAIVSLGTTFSVLFFGWLSRKFDKSTEPMKLLGQYRTATVVRYGLLHGPILFCIVIFFLGMGAVYLLMAFAVWLYLVSLHPTQNRIGRELGLKP